MYAIALDWPDDGLTIESLSAGQLELGRIESVSLIGSREPLKWSQGVDGLTVGLPREKPCEHAFALRIEVKDR